MLHNAVHFRCKITQIRLEDERRQRLSYGLNIAIFEGIYRNKIITIHTRQYYLIFLQPVHIAYNTILTNI